jgi:hypothetical protein
MTPPECWPERLFRFVGLIEQQTSAHCSTERWTS